MAKYPIIKSVTVTPTNPPEFEGLYVQSVTDIDVVVDIDFGPNPTKRRCVIDYHIPYYNLSYFEEKTTAKFKIAKYDNAPQHEIRVTAENGTDKANKTVYINTTLYNPPTLSIENERYSTDSVKVTLKGKVDSVGGRNTRTLKLRWRDVKSSTYYAKNIPLSSWYFEEVTYISGIPSDQSLEIIGELTDAAKTETAYSQNGTVLMSRLVGGKGVSFFQEARNEGFWIRDFNYDIPSSAANTLGSNMLVEVLLENRGMINSNANTIEGVNASLTALQSSFNDLKKAVLEKEVLSLGPVGTITLFPAFNMGFVRMYKQTGTEWAAGTTHVIASPSYFPQSNTALACQSVANTSARITANGDVEIRAISKVAKGVDIYVSGVFMYV